METEIDTIDVQSLAYRRQQLEVMARLLKDDEFFQEYGEEHNKSGTEAVWQCFFDQNQWVFGFALHYVIGEGVSPERLEQVVAGYSIGGPGKRADALLRTRGVLQSLCYVEIKTHKTQLLHNAEYRPGVWRPSADLSGAIAQAQTTVQLAFKHLGEHLEVHGEIFFNYAPRSIVVCGSLGEFYTEGGMDEGRFASFELLRRSIMNPDILTFDELHNRAQAVVEAGIARSERQS